MELVSSSISRTTVSASRPPTCWRPSSPAPANSSSSSEDLGKLEAERLLTGASPTDVRRSLVGVDALILGSVVEFGRETTGDRQVLEQLAPSRFKEIFGAEAVFFVTIRDWSTKYLVLASNVTVRLSYKLVDTRTGRVLWQGEQRVVRESGGGGVGIGGLIAAAVSALVTTAIDYRPLAREANFRALGAEGRGLPAGPYHPEYQKDYAKYQ